MSGFCGWFSTIETPGAGTAIDAMLAACHMPVSDPSRRTHPRGESAVYGDVARPQHLDLDEFELIVAGHPRFGNDGKPADFSMQELARRLRTQGRRALESLAGDFALAAFDRRNGRGLLAIDRIGAHHLVYARTPGTLVFGTSLDLVGGHPGVRRALSQQALYDYLYYHVVPGPRTIYEDCLRVPPGHCVEFGAGAPTESVAYWTMQFNEDDRDGVDTLKQRFMALLEESVRSAADSDAVGSFLSGGTDSSTVTGMLGRVSGRPAESFSIGFDVAGYDETGYARIAAKHYGCSHHEYFVTPPDVVAAVRDIARSYDQPFGNSSALPSFHCASQARAIGGGDRDRSDGDFRWCHTGGLSPARAGPQ